MKKLVLLLLLVVAMAVSTTDASAASFTKKQKKVVDTIYDVVSKEKNWEEYGSLPSICIAQAYVESGLGSAGRKNNLWGLNGGRASYKTLKKGVYAYMKCINKSWYTKYGATDTKSWKKQIRRILKGGYCVPASGYYKKVARVVKAFDLQDYDKEMFKDHKEAEKKRLEAAKLKKAKEKAKKAKEKEEKEAEERVKRLLKQREILEDIPTVLSNVVIGFSGLAIG